MTASEDFCLNVFTADGITYAKLDTIGLVKFIIAIIYIVESLLIVFFIAGR